MLCLRSRRVKETGRRNTDEEEKRSSYSGTGNDAVTGSGHGTGGKSAFGLDFGYTNDPAALFVGFIDTKDKKIYVYDEMYAAGLSNERIADNVQSMGYGKERIIADSAEPKSIDQLKGLGLRKTQAADYIM